MSRIACGLEVELNAFRYVKLVLWSFFGIRRGQAASEELGQARPLPLILMAVTLAGCFALFLILLAIFAARAFA